MNDQSSNANSGRGMISIELSASDKLAIQKLSQLALELTGVQLNERHQSMVASRLGRRISELDLSSLSEYVDYLNSHRMEESPKFISLLTTHHTYFFREFSHFEMIQNRILSQLIPIAKKRPDKKIRIWSAACSRGQEVYSLAMFLDFHLKRMDPTVQFEILGSDVDAESVAIAKNGVYMRNELKEVPMNFLGDHWARGTGEIEAYVKAKKTLRERCRFQTSNLLELKSGGSPNEKFDLIFCRNVFIYFNSEQIQKITQSLLERLSSDGYLFVGISESLSSMKMPIDTFGPSIYRHKTTEVKIPDSKEIGSTASIVGKPTSSMPSMAPAPAVVRPIRVLCVDDSPSILTLLKQILTQAHGFEIVGVAKNWIEAGQQVQALKPDVMTLDIHMPEQTGIEYLEKNYKTGHPPVVMVTSVSRENAELAGRALSLGAADYVEKPALTNLVERGEEIRNKVKCALLLSSNQSTLRLSLDQSFQTLKSISDLDKKLRVVYFPLSARAKLKTFLNEFKTAQPHTVLLVDGAKDALPTFAELLTKETGKKVVYSAECPVDLKSNELTLLDASSGTQKLWETHGKKRKTSILVFGDVSAAGAEKLLQFQSAQLVLEDLGQGKGAKSLMEVASDVVPFTSFSYLSVEFFCEDEKAGVKKVA